MGERKEERHTPDVKSASDGSSQVIVRLSVFLSLASAGWLVSLARTQTCFAEEKTGLWLLHLQTTAAARVFIHEN